MNNKRLVVLSYGFGTEEVFKELFEEVVIISSFNKLVLKEGDVVVFEGGTDINTNLYDQHPNSFTGHFDHGRDAFESMVFRQAKEKGIPMIAICRGAQLVCALSGGKLVQHCTGHGRPHLIEDMNGEIYPITSSHHQMMLPQGTNHVLIAKSKEKHSSLYIGEHNKKIEVEDEAEIVWFEDTKSLAIQGHPEFLPSTSDFGRYCRQYVKKFILEENHLGN